MKILHAGEGLWTWILSEREHCRSFLISSGVFERCTSRRMRSGYLLETVDKRVRAEGSSCHRIRSVSCLVVVQMLVRRQKLGKVTACGEQLIKHGISRIKHVIVMVQRAAFGARFGALDDFDQKTHVLFETATALALATDLFACVSAKNKYYWLRHGQMARQHSCLERVNYSLLDKRAIWH